MLASETSMISLRFSMPSHGAHRNDVEGRTHEGDRQDVELLAPQRLQADPVLVGRQTSVEDRGRQREAGLALDDAASAHDRAHGLAGRDDVEGHAAVADVDLVADLEHRQHTLALDIDGLSTRLLVEALEQLDLRTQRQFDRRGAERSRADLGTGYVDHERQVRGEGADAAQAFDARRDIPVGEGEAKDVHPGPDEVLDDLVAVGRRSDRGNNSRASH
jgi:hypothetical protein